MYTRRTIRWPRYLTPNHLIQILRQQKNPLTALHIFNSAPSLFPHYRHNFPVYATLVDIFASSSSSSSSSSDHLLNHIDSILDQLQTQHVPCKNDSIFRTTINLYSSHLHHLNRATSLFHSIPSIYLCNNSTQSFLSLLDSLLSDNHLLHAHQLLVECSQRHDIRVDTRTFHLLLQALCNEKRVDLAIMVFLEIERTCGGVGPDRECYKVLMKGLCEEKRLEDAKHLLYSMFWRVSQKGCGGDVVVYRMFLEALCEDGRVEEAGVVLSEVLKKGLKAPKKRCQVPDFGAEFAKKNISVGELKSLINRALVKG